MERLFFYTMCDSSFEPLAVHLDQVTDSYVEEHRELLDAQMGLLGQTLRVNAAPSAALDPRPFT